MDNDLQHIRLWSFSCCIAFSVFFHCDKGLFSLVGVRRAEIGNRVFEGEVLLQGPLWVEVAELLEGVGAVRIVGGEGRRGGEAGAIRGLKRRGGVSNGCGVQPAVAALSPWAPGVQPAVAALPPWAPLSPHLTTPNLMFRRLLRTCIAQNRVVGLREAGAGGREEERLADRQVLSSNGDAHHHSNSGGGADGPHSQHCQHPRHFARPSSGNSRDIPVGRIGKHQHPRHCARLSLGSSRGSPACHTGMHHLHFQYPTYCQRVAAQVQGNTGLL